VWARRKNGYAHYSDLIKMLSASLVSWLGGLARLSYQALTVFE
jgi:hypothetical protein